MRIRKSVGSLLCTLLLAQPACSEAADSLRAREIHDKLLVLDTHLDAPANFGRPGWDIMQRHEYATDFTQLDYPRMVAGGLDGGFWAIYTPQGPRTEAGHQAARDAALIRAVEIREMVAAHREQFEIALNAQDAARIAKEDKRVVYMSIENGYPIGHDLSLLKTFYELGVRLFGPVHFRNNELGDSSTDTPQWQGLSPLGKQVVGEANRLGIVLDASHASDQVLDQLIELSTTPVVLSHSGCKAVYNHPRNIDDGRLRKLAAAGGVIQINSYSEYLIPVAVSPERRKALADLTEKYADTSTLTAEKIAAAAKERQAIDAKYPVTQATFEDFMRHLLHALKVVGPEHVGIGPDWDGGGGVVGMADIADLPKITARLLEAGYSEKDLGNIWSGNVLRVLRKAEDQRDAQRP